MAVVANPESKSVMRPLDDAEFDRWVRLLEARTGVIVPPEDYLPRLRQMMEANRGNQKVVATFMFMQTEPAR